MKISVFGLGYVGTVTAGCLARAGHDVVGVEIQADRVAQVSAGRCPIVEPGAERLIAEAVASGHLTATTEVGSALDRCEVALICVGTPADDRTGGLDLRVVEGVCVELARVLARTERPGPLCIAVRSTVMPGTIERCVDRMAGLCGPPGQRFTLCANPEFMRESSAIDDFMDPPFTLVGTVEKSWARPLRELYGFLSAPFLVVPVGVSEILKLVSNTWHAAKVCFANEVSRLCQPLGIDPHQLMELFLLDRRLNLSARYLRPGFAYGGSCLPKDVAAVTYLAQQHHLDLPLLLGIPRSNALLVQQAMRRILATGCRRVGFLGLSFKPDTDDLRGSPLVDLVEFCLGKGLQVRVYDPTVQPARLVGSNRRYAQQRLGHIAELLVDDAGLLARTCDLVVLGHGDPAFAEVCRALPPSVRLLDLAGALRPGEVEARYEGINW